MEFQHAQGDEDIAVIREALDVVKTARYQFGTLTHMSDDLESSVGGLRSWLQGVQEFLSDGRNVALAAASIIAAAVCIDYARGWFKARRGGGQPLRFARRLARLI
jgi:hypothetical protein